MGTRRHFKLLPACALAILMSALASPAHSQTAYAPDQSVEVREGDEWSKATVIKKEGRKIQIRYDDGTEEWVTSDRLRAGDGGAAPPASPSETSSETAKPVVTSTKSASAGSKRKFKPNDRVQIRQGLRSWEDATVVAVQGTQALIKRAPPFDDDIFQKWHSIAELRFPGEPDPLEGLDTRERLMRARNAESLVEDPDRPLKHVDLNEAQELSFGDSPQGFTPDAKPVGSLKPRTIGLRSMGNSQSRFVTAIFGDSQMFVQSRPIANKAPAQALELVDLAAGKSTGLWPLMLETKVAAMRDDAKVVAVQSDGIGFGKKGRIDIYSVGDKPKYQVGFVPYENVEKVSKFSMHFLDVNWVGFVERKYLVTAGAWPKSQVVLWELPACKPIWKTTVSMRATPAISPGGKQVAIPLENMVVVVNGASGDVLASIRHEEGSGKLQFSPEGEKLLLAAESGSLCIFDLTSGKLTNRFSTQLNSDAQWVDSGHVLLGGQLYSLEHSLPLWKYEVEGAKFKTVGGIAWYSADKGQTMVSCRLPTDDALQAEKNINDSFFMLKPGESVSLEVNLGDISAEVTENLKEQLGKLNLNVADGQPIRLRALVEPGETKEEYYRVFHRGAGRRSTSSEITHRTIQRKVMKIEIVGPDGRAGWFASSIIYPPSEFSTEGGETIDAAIARLMMPKASWYHMVKLPSHTPKAEFAEGFGKSSLTATGELAAAP